MRYLKDLKEDFPALYHFGVDKFCPHITTEVHYESLFSQAWFLSEIRRARTGICMSEILVLGNYCFNLIHCYITIFKELFIKLRKENLWEEEHDQDDRAFLKLEKEILKEMFPHSSDILEAEEE